LFKRLVRASLPINGTPCCNVVYRKEIQMVPIEMDVLDGRILNIDYIHVVNVIELKKQLHLGIR